MTETGKVIKVEKDFVTVRFQRKTECENCKMCIFSQDMTYLDIKMKNTVNAQIDDIVKVSTKGKTVLISSLIVYIVPLLFTLLGLFLGYIILGENLAIVFAMVFLALGFLSIAIIDKLLKRKNKNVIFTIKSIVK